jgi:hypothetical protein
MSVTIIFITIIIIIDVVVVLVVVVVVVVMVIIIIVVVVVVVLAWSSLITAARKGTRACQLLGFRARGVASSGSYVHRLNHSGKLTVLGFWRQVPPQPPAEGVRKTKPGRRRRKKEEKPPWIGALLFLCFCSLCVSRCFCSLLVSLCDFVSLLSACPVLFAFPAFYGSVSLCFSGSKWNVRALL